MAENISILYMCSNEELSTIKDTFEVTSEQVLLWEKRIEV